MVMKRKKIIAAFCHFKNAGTHTHKNNLVLDKTSTALLAENLSCMTNENIILCLTFVYAF